MGGAPSCSKVGLHRGPWTTREDPVLVNYIQVHGDGRWRYLPKKAGLLRCGKSCRLRWMNYLRPYIKRGNITPDEEDLTIRLHSLPGNRWSLIAVSSSQGGQGGVGTEVVQFPRSEHVNVDEIYRTGGFLANDDHDFVNGSNFECQYSHVPAANHEDNSSLRKLYEEYLQLLKTTTVEHVQLDSFSNRY